MRKYLDLQEIQQIEFKILCEFQSFCEKWGLHPILAYGTLLGAVRHKGFIPWDDDIDVYLKRDEYEKLIQIYNAKNTNENYKLVSCVENSKEYLFVKIVDLRTGINRPSAFIREPKRLWIDVFPLDGIPDNKQMRRIHTLASAMYISWFGLANTNPDSNSRKGVKGLFNRFWGYFYDNIVGTERICRLSTMCAKKYKVDRYNDCFCFTWNLDGADKGSFACYGLENLVDVEFEGKRFKAMSNYDEYLTRCYGNYMELPPEEKRISHKMDAWIEE